MKKIIFSALLGAGFLIFTACDNKDNIIDPVTPIAQSPVNEGVVILNTGNIYSGIEGDISRLYYCCDSTKTDTLEKAQIANNIFSVINKRTLGATPNDIIRHGSKIYVAVDGSNTIEIMDAGVNPYKSIKQIALAGDSILKTPRKLVAEGKYVYVSMMSGHIARIDTLTLSIDKVVNVGVATCPEGMAISNHQLYVATSGDWQQGYLSTISRINLNTFTTTETLSCGLNPTAVQVDGNGNVYVLCMGDYAATKAAIYQLKETGTEKLCEATMFDIDKKNNILYAINCAWDVYPITYFSVNLNTKEQTPLNVQVTYPAALAFDPTHNYLVITSYKMGGYGYPSYDTPGYLSVFTTTGKELTRKDVGVSPTCITFL